MGYVEGLLGTNEQIIRKSHRHWIVVTRPALVYGGLTILLLALAVAFVVRGERLGELKNLPAALLVALAAWFFALLMLAILRWRNEVYVLTNRRIIQVEGIINKLTVDSSLDKINDVVLAQSALGRLLGYGDLEILTASEHGVNRLTTLSRALAFKADMLNAKEGLRTAGHAENMPASLAAATTVPDLSEALRELNEMRQQGLISDEEFQAKRSEVLRRM